MALLRRLILSPSLSTSTTCFSGEPQQQIPSKSLSSLFHKTHQKSLNLSLSLALPFVFPLSRTRLDRHFQAHYSPALESPPSSSAEPSSEEEALNNDRVYAQNVPWDCTPEDIRALFEKYGTVRDVELSMFNQTRNRGLAFVTMGSPEEALEAIKNLQSYELNGRIIKLAYARPKKVAPKPEPKPPVTFNLFVANLSFEARAKDLKEFFKSEGFNVVSAEVIFHDKPRKSLGYGFASFKSKKEAESALVSVQGKLCLGRPIRVARCRQFVKRLTPESIAKFEEALAESDSGLNEAETAQFVKRLTPESIAKFEEALAESDSGLNEAETAQGN